MNEYNLRTVTYVLLANLALATFFTVLRCYVRIFMMRKFLLDDWLAVAALLVHSALFGPFVDEVRVAGYLPHPPLDSVKIERRLKDEWVCLLLYIIGIGIVKVSFGYTLLRIIVEKAQRVLVYVLMVLVVGITISIMFIIIYNCIPVSYQWTRARDPYAIALFLGVKDPGAEGLKPQGNCKSTQTYGTPAVYAQAVVTMILDAMLGLVMPYIILRKLKMRRSLKVTAFAVLALGSIPSIASIIRLRYTYTFNSPNALDTAVPLFVWSIIEMSWCQIGTSLTTLKPLASRFGFFRDPSTQSSPQYRTTPRPEFGRKYWTDDTVDTEMAQTTTTTVWKGSTVQAINSVGGTDVGWSQVKSQMDSEFTWTSQ